MESMHRLHLVSMPHTETINGPEFSWCAYTGKVRRFAEMMSARGHHITLYSGEKNDAACDEHVPTMTATDRARLVDGEIIRFEPTDEAWITHNAIVIHEMRQRIQPGDMILLIAGRCQAAIAEAFPNNPSIEFGVGYAGTFAPYCVYESRAWQHVVYGSKSGFLGDPDGRNYDDVIPNYFDVDEFEARPSHSGYLLYLGRLRTRKGYNVASLVAQHLDVPLILAGGQEDPVPGYGEYIGRVGPDDRRELLANAAAVFVPTQYVEPFGGVAVEALLSGAPVITSDFGAFPEYVLPRDGWRCHTLHEFVQATEKALAARGGRDARRKRAVARFSYDAIAPRYETYLDRVAGLAAGHEWNWLPSPD